MPERTFRAGLAVVLMSRHPQRRSFIGVSCIVLP